MMSKSKKRKGFTLIELIVVIAVLAVLALIAVPRLAGFTDKAKESNDREYANLVAHSVQTMIASGDFKYDGTNDIVITIKPADGTVTGITNVTTGTINPTEIDKVNAALTKLQPAEKIQSNATAISATIDHATNKIKVDITLP